MFFGHQAADTVTTPTEVIGRSARRSVREQPVMIAAVAIISDHFARRQFSQQAAAAQ